MEFPELRGDIMIVRNGMYTSLPYHEGLAQCFLVTLSPNPAVALFPVPFPGSIPRSKQHRTVTRMCENLVVKQDVVRCEA